MKEQRRRALHRNVIDAVVHQIAAHGVVQVHHESEFQLGADAIHAGNQHRLAEFLFVDRKHAAEAANLTYHSLGEGAMGKIFDSLLSSVGAVDINTAVSVGK